jgi:hypothetical protein
VIAMLVAPLVAQLSVLLDPGLTPVGFAVNELIVGAPEFDSVPEPLPEPFPEPAPDPLPLFPVPLVFDELFTPPQPANPKNPAKTRTNRRFFPGNCRGRRPEPRKRDLAGSNGPVVAILVASLPTALPLRYWP